MEQFQHPADLGGPARAGRSYYLDLLKIISAFFVILIHVTAENWYGEVRSAYWLVNNTYNAVSRWSVPVFCMVSGALLLSRDIPLKKLFRHYILRMALLLVFWALAYGVYSGSGPVWARLLATGKGLLQGKAYSHLWYLFMLLGLYLVTPLLRAMVRGADRKLLRYFVICAGLWVVVLPTLLKLTPLKPLSGLLEALQVRMFGGYVFYYVAGYYLHTFELPKWLRTALFAAAPVLLAATALYSDWRSWQDDHQYVNYGVFSVGTALFALAIFTFARQLGPWLEGRPWPRRAIGTLGPLTFGIYLVHFGVEKVLLRLGLNSNVIHPLLGAPLLSLLIFLLCAAGCWVLSRIPGVRRLIL